MIDGIWCAIGNVYFGSAALATTWCIIHFWVNWDTSKILSNDNVSSYHWRTHDACEWDCTQTYLIFIRSLALTALPSLAQIRWWRTLSFWKAWRRWTSQRRSQKGLGISFESSASKIWMSPDDMSHSSNCIPYAKAFAIWRRLVDHKF